MSTTEINQSLKTNFKLLIFLVFAEIFGFLIGLLSIIIRLFFGVDINVIFFDKAFNTLYVGLFLRSISPAFGWVLVLIIILLTVNLIILFRNLEKTYHLIDKSTDKPSIDVKSHGRSKSKYLRFGAGMFIGYIIAEFLLYEILNSIFYRGAFVSLPFAFGSLIVITSLLIMRIDPSIIYFVSNVEYVGGKSTKSDTPKKSRRRKNQKIIWLHALNITKIGLIIAMGFLLIIPNLTAMLGFLPTPPSIINTGFGAETGQFDVEIIKIRHDIPQNISDMLVDDNSDGNWYYYVYLPVTSGLVNQSFPVHFYLHGFSGSNVDLYDSSLRTIASEGVISIFVQYVTNVNLQGDLAQIISVKENDDPDLYVRYIMLNSGINQAIDDLSLNSDKIEPQFLEDNLGQNFEIDFSRLLIIGHSMGGGMVPYVASELLKKGFGSNSLILDLEAPWYNLDWVGFEINYLSFPNYTLVNVAVYEDDLVVSQCIGMDFYEKMRVNQFGSLSDNQLKFIYIKSDRYGFPRLVATHYLPADPLNDPIHSYAYKKRIDAMAIYLWSQSISDVGTITESLTYFLGSEIINVGLWNDGRRVNQPIISIDPYGLRNGDSLVDILSDDSNELCTI